MSSMMRDCACTVCKQLPRETHEWNGGAAERDVRTRSHDCHRVFGERKELEMYDTHITVSCTVSLWCAW